VIRWIASFLGTAPASRVSLEPGQRLLDVRDLVDREGNAKDAVREKMEQGLDWLRQGWTVIVGCDYGMSRSNAVAAGLLCVYRNMPYDEAVRQVIQATGEKEIKLGPIDAVRLALGAEKKGDAQGIRVLVTGGSGFLGTFLQPMMASRWPVFAPPRKEADLVQGALQLDLKVRAWEITHVVHLAHPRIFTSNQALGAALTMLRNVLEVCESNALHLIYPSSMDIYSGHGPSGGKVDASLPPRPRGPHGETKWLCESLIDHHRQHSGLRCGVLRCPPLYGSNAHVSRPKFLQTFVDCARLDKPIRTHVYRNGFPLLDLLHARDCCKAMIAAIENDLKGEVNLGTGRLISTREMALMVRDILGSRSVMESVPIDDDAPNIDMDCAQAADRLSWAPSIDFESGLAEMVSPDGDMVAALEVCHD